MPNPESPFSGFFKLIGKRLFRQSGFLSVSALFVGLILSSANASAFTILRVAAGATAASPDGSTWAKAYPTLQEAISKSNVSAANPVEIWIKAGIYHPTSGSDRSATFAVKSHMTLRGGFAGFENSPGERPVGGSAVPSTVLSGDIGAAQPDAITAQNAGRDRAIVSFDPATPQAEDNSYNVLCAENVINVMLERLVVAGGHSDNNTVSPVDLDGMIYPDLGDVIPGDPDRARVAKFRTESTRLACGAGLFSKNSTIAVNDCQFIGNYARSLGGGISVRGGSIDLQNTRFVRNVAGQSGGGLSIQAAAAPNLIANSFYGNAAAVMGGAVYVQEPVGSSLLIAYITNAIESLCAMTYEDFDFTRNEKLNYDYMRVVKSTAAVALAVIKGIAIPKLIQTFGTRAMINLSASLSPLTLAYGVVSMAMLLGDLSAEIAKAFGVDPNDPGMKAWAQFSAGFAAYATPDGLAKTFFNAFYDGPTFVERATPLRNNDYETNHNKAPPLKFIGNAFEENHTTGIGGAIVAIRTNVLISRSSILNNSSAFGGGAAGFFGYNNGEIENSVIRGNSTARGASVALLGYRSVNRFINNTITDNHSGSPNGYAISADAGADVTIANSILWRNTSGDRADPTNPNRLGGADVFATRREDLSQFGKEDYDLAKDAHGLYTGTAEVQYCNIESLDRLALGGEIFFEPGDYLFPNYRKWGVLVESGRPNVGEGITIGGGGNISVNPMLVQGIYPHPYSPIIDAANDEIIFRGQAYDFTGFLRGTGSQRIDIGAVESNGRLPAGVILHVDANASPQSNGLGLDWANAIRNLSDALKIPLSPGGQIWVTGDTYKATSATGQPVTMELAPGVALIGGFAVGATSADQFNPQNPTIIEGFLTPGGERSPTLLRGLTTFPVSLDNYNYVNRELMGYPRVIRNLEFRNALSTGTGAAVELAVPAVVDQCKFVNNNRTGDGSALSITDPAKFYGYAAGKVINSEFSLNGRAIDCHSDNLEVIRSRFYDNFGGIYKHAINQQDSLLLERNIFYSNSAGAVIHEGSSLVAAHNVFANNTGLSPLGGAGLTWRNISPQGNYPRKYQLVNNIFHGNRIAGSTLPLEIQQCLLPDYIPTFVKPVIAGNAIEGLNTIAPRGGVSGNVDFDPGFTDAAGHDFSLKPDSYLNNNGVAYDSSSESATVINGDYRDIGVVEGTSTIRRTPATLTLTAQKPTAAGRTFVLKAQNFDLTPADPVWEVFRPGASAFVPVTADGRHSATTYEYSYPGGVQTISSISITITNPLHTWNGSVYRLRYSGSGYSNGAALDAPPSILFVDGAKNGDGTTWTSAFKSLSSALAIAQPYTQIWVRQGYHSMSAMDIPAGVRIFGGFSGGESIVDQRDPQAHPTVFVFPNGASLQTNGTATWAGDSSAVPTVIDSLTFTNPSSVSRLLWFRNADVSVNTCTFTQFSGSAIYSYQTNLAVADSAFNECGGSPLYILNSSLTVNGSSFTRNQNGANGAAILLNSSGATIADCLFSENRGGSGGAIGATGGSLDLQRCRFLDNTATSGGAIHLSYGTTTRIANSLFARNRAASPGGAINHATASGTLTLVHDTFVDNSSGNAGGAIMTQSGFSLTNSIVWGNTAAFGGGIYGPFTLIESHVQGQGSAGFSPLFDPSSADYALSANSPLLNRGGTNVGVNGSHDISSMPRLGGAGSDLGASEFQGTAATPLYFTTPPASQTVYADRPVTFSLAGNSGSLTGTALAFTWEYLNGGTWSPISNYPGWITGAGTLSFAKVTQAMDGLQIRGVVSGMGTLPAMTLTVLPRKVLRVDGRVATSGNGSTWSAAYKTLTAALAAADGDTDLWIAGGDYPDTSPTAVAGVKILVGFAGNESSVAGRDPVLRPVRLTGTASYITLLPGTDLALPEIAFRITAAPVPVIRYVGRPIAFTARNDGSGTAATAWEYLDGSTWRPIGNLAGWTISQLGEVSTLSHPSATPSQNGLRVRAVTPGGNEESFPATLTVNPRTILYVDAARPQSGNGLSWATAFRTIAEALAKADDGSDIWIARGDYEERSLAFVAGANLYAGFTSGATNPADRDTTANPVLVRGPGSSVSFNTAAATGFRYSIASPLRSSALYINQPGGLSIGLAPGASSIEWQFQSGSNWLPISARPGWTVSTTGLTSKLIHTATPATEDGLKMRVIVPSSGEVSDTITLSVKIRRTLYVDGTAGEGGNGLTWTSAFRTIGDALAQADEGTDIWIADGAYTEATHSIGSGTHLYGGFQGNETDLAARSPIDHPVVLRSLSGAGVFNIDLTAAEFDLLTLIDSITIANGAPANPAVRLNGRSIAFESTTFIGSARAVLVQGTETRAAFNACTFRDNAEAISSDAGPTVSVGSSIFDSNIHALTFAPGSSLEVTASQFDRSNGHAISAAPGLILSDSAFTGNALDVVINGSDTALTQISESNFTGTTVCAITSATPVEIGGSDFTGVNIGLNLTGGATTSSLIDCDFSNGSDAVQSPGGLTIVNSTFTANARGLILTPSTDSVSSINGGNFSNNTTAAIQSAGAVNLTDATLTGNAIGLSLTAAADVSRVASTTFSENTTAISSVAGLTVIGSTFTDDVTGLAVSGGLLGTTVKDTSFTGITGTGIVSAARLATDNVTFADCALGVSLTGGTGISRLSTTTFTGGVSALAIADQARAEIGDSLFTKLSGTAFSASGATLADNVYNVQFTDSTFTQNTGPLFNSTGGGYKFERSKITNNTAPGPLIVSGGRSLFFINSLVAGNTATTGGSTIRVNAGSLSIGTSTIADNETGNAVGVVSNNGGASIFIRQSILWGNRASATLARLDLMQADQAGADITTTIVEGVQPFSWQQAELRNIPLDPLFTNASGGDYTLQPYSPAIDAAGATFPGNLHDLAGADRVQSTYMDFGAYESPFARAASPLLIGFASGPRTIVTGDSTTYTVTFAIGNGRSIRWQVDDGSGNFVDLIADARHSSSYVNGVLRLTVAGDSSLNGRRYRAVVTENGSEIYVSPASTFTVVSRPVYYVDATATGNGSGTDWTNAYTSLHTALTSAVAFSDINVAKGTYRAPANDSFDLRRRQRLLGGWDPATSTRNPSANATILSSAAGAPSTSVIVASNADQGVVDNLTTIDGFTFTSGGVGLQLPQASPVVRNCRFENLSTGIYLAFGQLSVERSSFTGLTRCAIIANGNDCDLTITGCSFINNAGGVSGAGALALGEFGVNASSASQRAYIADSIFRGNTGARGGAISMLGAGSSVEIGGCEFTDNVSTELGGAIYGNSNNNVTVRQSLLARNQSALGAAIYCSGTTSFTFCTIANNRVTAANAASIHVTNSLTLRDSIVWGNSSASNYLGQNTQIQPTNGTFSFSDTIIQDLKEASGTRLLPFDPKFTDVANGDFTLAANSPAIGIAQAADLLPGEPDLTGTPRPAGAAADLGAYESAASPAPVHTFGNLPASLAGFGGTTLTLTQAVPNGYDSVWEYFNGTAWVPFPVLGQGTGGPAGALSSYSVALAARESTLRLQNITSALNGTQVRYVLSKDGTRYQSAVTTVTVTSFEAIYVDASVSASGNGQSWPAAYKTLNEGLSAVTTTRRVIYVAKGTYRGPFSLPMRFEMYGGFPSGGSSFADRSPSTQATVLTGLPVVDGDARASSVVRFVYSGSNFTQPILDGFTIENGQTGLLAEADVAPALRNLIVRGNTNSGIILPTAGATIEDSILESNSGVNGGGIQANNAVTLDRVILRGNTATRGGGGYLLGNSVLRNVLVSGNVATTGGGLSISGISPRIEQTTIAGNRAGNGPAIYSDYGPVALRNSIVWGNRTPADAATTQLAASGNLSSFYAPDHTIIERSPLTTGVLAFNPLFTAPITAASAPNVAGDYTLNALSPAIDAGNGAFASGLSTDLAGATRFTGTIDLGPYESPAAPASPLIVTNESDSLFFNYNLVGNTFSVTAPAASAIVWQYALPGSLTWDSLVGVSGFSGATTSTLTVTTGNTAFNGYRVRAVLTAANGSLVNLEERTLTVYPPHLYVNANRTGNQTENGLTWETAFRSLDAALAAVPASPEGAELWLAAGTYMPATVFTVRAGIAIYGGFAGNETELDQRNPSVNVSALVGRAGQLTIVKIPATPANATAVRLDSLTLRDLSNPTGSGIDDESGRPLVIDRVRFTGFPYVAIRGNNANVIIRSSEFRGNGSPTNFPAVLSVGGTGGSLLIENTLFAGNSNAAGAFSTSSPTTLRNVTIAHNFGADAFSSYTSNLGIFDTILWGNRNAAGQPSTPSSSYNSTARNSLSENGGLNGFFTNRSGLIQTDPKFIAPVAATSTPTTAGNYSLAVDSGAIDVGYNEYAASTTLDLAGNARIHAGTVDMGAYEYQLDDVYSLATQPSDKVTTLGPATLSVTTTYNRSASYTWERSEDDGTTYLVVPGATASTLVVTGSAAVHNDLYRVRVRFSHGPMMVSNAARISHLVATATAGLPGGYATPRTFTATVNGTPASWKWQFSTDGTTFTDVGGASGSSLAVIGDASFVNRTYRAVATFSEGPVIATNGVAFTYTETSPAPATATTGTSVAPNIAFGVTSGGVQASSLTDSSLFVHAGLTGRLALADLTTPLFNGDNVSLGFKTAPHAGEKFQITTSALRRSDGIGTRPRVWEFRSPVDSGPGIFASATPVGTSAATAFALGDFDDDGLVDALVATDTGLQRYAHNGNAAFVASGPSFGPAGATALATGSLTSSGALDAAAITSSGDVEIWTNSGSGVFALAQTLNALNARAFALGDLDADGDLDLLITTASENRVYLNNGAGAFTADATFGDTSGKTLAIGDLDLDGDLDVIVTGSSATNIWSNNGAAAFTSVFSIPSAFDRIAIADIDANGLADVALAVANAPATVLRNLGAFQFETLGSMPGGGSVPTLATGDTDGDGRSDLILTDGSGRTGAWVVTADLTITRAPGQPELAFGNHAELADLNGDGSLDLFGLDPSGIPAVSLYRVTATLGSEDSVLAIAPGGFIPSAATIHIRSLPVHGALLNGSTPVTIGTSFTLSQAASLTYRPAADYNGFDSFTWSATSHGTARTHWILVHSVPDNVVAAADSIALIQGGTVTTLVGGATSVLTNDSNRDAGDLVSTLIDNAAHGTVSLNADGTFTYVHDNTASFTDSFTYRAANLATGSLDSVTVSITITRHNAAPDTLTFSASSFLKYTGQAPGLTIGTIAATDPNPEDAGLLTFTLVSGNDDFALTGTTLKTVASIDASAGFTRSVRVRATDSLGASLEQDFTISFFQPPTAVAANYAINEDTPVKLILGGTGGSSPLTWQIVNLPANGTLSRDTEDLRENAYIYTPAVDFNGIDSFTYRVIDSALSSDTVTINLAIAAVNDVPTLAAIAPITINEDASATFTLSGNDAENSPLAYQLSSLPVFGAVQLSGATVTYTPAADASGIEILSFTASDGVNTSEPLQVTINVTAVNDAPVLAAIAPRAIIRNTTDTFTATVTDVDSSSPTLRVASQPQHGTVVISSTTVTYVPATGFTGTDSYTLIARDEALDSAPVAVEVSVNNIATENVGLLVYRGLSEYSEIPVAASGDWSGVLPGNISTPAHGTVAFDGSRLLYAHDGGSATADSFTYTLTNSADEIRTILVSITINNHILDATNGSASGAGSLGAAIAIANRYPTVSWTIRILPGSETDWFLPGATPQDHGPACFRISGKVTVDASASPGFVLATSSTQTRGRHFTVLENASLTLKDLCLNNGDASTRNGASPFPYGGSVLNFGTFTAQNVEFRNSRAVIGTAIYNDGGTVSLTGCTFKDCFALSTEDPGGIVASRNGSISLSGVGFTNNMGNANGDLYVFGDAALATVTVSDSVIGSYNLATVNGGTLSVTGLLKAFDDNATRQTGQTLNLTVDSLLANDSGAPFNNVTVDATSAKGGSISRTGGNLTYTAPTNLNGDDSFSYTITTAAGNSSTATVKIITNSKPLGRNDAATIYRGLSESIDVLANDLSESGGALVISAVSTPAHGTAVIKSNKIVYTHDNGASATDSFTYSISNSSQTTTNITVSLTIRDRVLIANNSANSGTGTLRAALATVDQYFTQTPANTTPLEWSVNITGAANQTWTTTTHIREGDPASRSTFAIRSNVTIDASASPGFKLSAPMSGGDPVRNFLVRPGARLTLKNFTLLGVRPGVSPFDVTMGGAVLNYGTFIAETVIFKHHTAHLGAAVYNNGGTLSLQDCSFIENIVEEYYRSDAGDGVVASRNGTLTLTRPIFASAPYSNDPELYVLGDGATATVHFNTLPNYSYSLATRNGGAISTPGLPIAKEDAVAVQVGAEARIPISTLLANDSDSAGTTFTVGTTDRGAGVSRHGDFIIYQPSDAYYQDDSFSYTLTTASGYSSTARVNLALNFVPEITVALQDVSELADGDKVDLGTIPAGSTTRRTFVIGNAGYVSLGNISVTMDGGNPDDFQISGPDMPWLNRDESTAFTVTFAPSEPGRRSATLRIASDDPDEAPFDIPLEGFANTVPAFDGYAISTASETPATISLAKLLTKASDADGDILSITAAGPSSNGGTTTLQATGILYTPPAGFSGDDTFPITVTDAHGTTVSGEITVTVQPSSSSGGVGANTPKLTVMPQGKISLSFQGIPGRSYLIQRSTTLADGSWSTIATLTAGETGKLEFIDDNPPPGSGFYRLARP